METGTSNTTMEITTVGRLLSTRPIPSADTKLSPKHGNPSSERADYIEQFTERVNQSRRGAGFKILPARAIAVKLAHLTIQDLHAFWKQCDRSANFSKTFWGALKPRDYGATKGLKSGTEG